MPMVLSLASLSAEPDVPITVQPSALPICTAATPTPDDAPATSSVSPFFSLPYGGKISSYAVRNATPTEAPCSHVSFSGIGISCSARAAQYSAQPPITRPNTLSPTLKPVTPAPTACTTPAPSPPPSFSGPPCTTLPTMSSPRLSDDP